MTMLHDLIRRYDRPVPRYTSYPTAPHLTAPPSAAELAAWQAAVPPDEGLSLYVHVPYCQSMCWYCGCTTKVTQRHEPVAALAVLLQQEIALAAAAVGASRKVTHLHFGGGTPTILAGHELRAIVTAVREHFAVDPEAEIAIEVDPRTLDPGRLNAIGAAGFNRASLGVQDLDQRVQAAIGRIQPLWMVQTAMRRLRESGVAGLNVDVIYGLPLQTTTSIRRTIEDLVDLGPDRFALFGYAHVPWVKPHQRLIDADALPDAAARWDLLAEAQEALARAGYVAIGLDHFARADDPLAVALAAGRLHRNFQGYTDDAATTLIGLGPSAISRYREGYTQNPVPIRDWQRMVESGVLTASRGRELSADDRLRGAIIERLMCDFAVDVDAVAAESDRPSGSFTAEIESLQGAVRDGLVAIDGARLAVPEPMRPLVRIVAAAFDAYLTDEPRRHAKAV